MERPQIRYARSGDVHVAFQVMGNGPVDVVLAPGRASHLDVMWDHPYFRRVFQTWSAVARLLLFDKRGTGLSDRPTEAATLEERADDFRAVMDAAGSERAVVYGQSEGGQLAAAFAALHPERTIALATFGTMARYVRTERHPWGLTKEQNDELLRDIAENWPSESYARAVAGLGPQADPEFVQFVIRLSRYGASPSAALALQRMTAGVDITDVLPTIPAPALIMRNAGDTVVPAAAVRAMADAIPGGRFREFPGSTHIAGESLEDVVSEVMELATGRRPQAAAARRLLTILVLDVVESTRRAVDEGDAGWSNVLRAQYAEAEGLVKTWDGREVDRAGDGLLAVFEGPTRAIRCAQAIQASSGARGLELRAGVHTGEVEVDGTSVKGIAVHTAARICSAAGGGELYVSSTVRDLTAGAGLALDDRGEYELKGLPERRRLYAVLR